MYVYSYSYCAELQRKPEAKGPAPKLTSSSLTLPNGDRLAGSRHYYRSVRRRLFPKCRNVAVRDDKDRIRHGWRWDQLKAKGRGGEKARGGGDQAMIT